MHILSPAPPVSPLPVLVLCFSDPEMPTGQPSVGPHHNLGPSALWWNQLLPPSVPVSRNQLPVQDTLTLCSNRSHWAQ